MPERIRVMTYNIHNGIGIDGSFDLDRVAATIEAVQPDVIGLQEVGRHWNEESRWVDQAVALTERLGLEVHMFPIRDHDPPEGRTDRRVYGCAVCSRIPIVRTTNHFLSRIDATDPAQQVKPMPGFAEVVLNLNGVEISFFNTHLYWRAAEVRLLEVEEMLQITDVSRPVILVGDMNAEPGDAELTRLKQRFVDAWDVCGVDDGLTFPANAPASRIDYILTTREISAERVEVVSSDASDHLPLVAMLRVDQAADL